MRTVSCLRSLLILTVLISSAGSAWCSRKDNGGSNYGEMAEACPGGAGAAPGLQIGCYSPQSNLTGVATILEFNSLGATYSSLTLDVSFPDGDPTDTMTFGGNFGLIVCDHTGDTVPCTEPSSTMNLITSGNDLVIQPGSPDTTTLTLGNVEGFVTVYFTSQAFVTNIVENSAPSSAPEPSSLALLGFGTLTMGISFFRRRSTKSIRP